jgi:putative transposase
VTDTNVFQLVQPGTFSDRLTEVLRDGARALLAQAIKTEVADFLAEHADKRTADGRQRVVRHGHLPERPIMTGIGPVEVSVPRVRDRLGNAADRIRFTSAILPPYARRSKSLEVLIPVHLLRRIRRGACCVARPERRRIVGFDHRTIEGSVGGRTCPLAQTRPLGQALCLLLGRWHLCPGALRRRGAGLLVIIGATPEGKKELVGLADGLRESAHSWRELLLDLKRRGLSIGPQLAVGDGALGFWKALDEVWPNTRAQRC